MQHEEGGRGVKGIQMTLVGTREETAVSSLGYTNEG